MELYVIGSINVDLIARVPRLPGPGETIGSGSYRSLPGGKGANQAAAAARLGARTTMIGAVGDDDAGRHSLAALADAGVETAGIQIVEGAPTGTALIMIDADGENSIAVCPGANDLARLDADLLAAADGVLVQLEVPMAVIEAAAAAAKGLFVVNAAPAMPLPRAVLDRADLIIVNEHEYAESPELARARRVVVSRGAEGAVLLEHGSPIAGAPSIPTTVVNTVGAGDAFAAALTVALLEGRSDSEALRMACAVGSAAVAEDRSQPLFSPLATYE